ncbi:MAG: glycosyltransferase family 39 protein [Limnospira sp.]
MSQSPEHAPLYFVLLRGWQHWFGSSVISNRSLSVIFNLLCFPFLYWLCGELFKIKEVGKVAIVLFAVSPFFVAYSQEARPYSLWTLTILLSSWALLRAIRLNQIKNWLLYWVTVIFGLYTSLFTAFILSSSTVYVLILEQFKLSDRLKNYLIFSGFALMAFIPWLAVIIVNLGRLQDNTNWAIAPMSSLTKLAILIYGFSTIFFDFLFPETIDILSMISGSAMTLFILAILVFATSFVCRKTPRNVHWFILCLIAVNPLILLGIDWILKGQTLATSRYLVPSYLGILLAVSYALASQVFYSESMEGRRAGIFIFALLVSIGLISCTFYTETHPTYQKGRSRNNQAIAHLIKKHPVPAIISEQSNVFNLLSLSHSLNSNLTIYWRSPQDLETALKPCQSFLVFNPSPEFILDLAFDRKSIADSPLPPLTKESSWNFEEIYKPKLLTKNDIYISLWRLKKIDPSCSKN